MRKCLSTAAATVLAAVLLAGCDSQLSVEQHVWCATHGEQVRTFRAAWDDNGNSWPKDMKLVEGATRPATVDELACWGAYTTWGQVD